MVQILKCFQARNTVMILSFRTDRSGQTSVDPDQTAPLREAVGSGSTLFAIPSASFGCLTLW